MDYFSTSTVKFIDVLRFRSTSSRVTQLNEELTRIEDKKLQQCLNSELIMVLYIFRLIKRFYQERKKTDHPISTKWLPSEIGCTGLFL